MKILKVEAIPFRIPIRKEVGTLRSAVVTMNSADHVFVCITTDDGIVGYAEAHERPTIYGETQASITRIVNDYIGPAIKGLELCDVEKITESDAIIVMIHGEHSCMTSRGIKKPGTLTTTVTYRGERMNHDSDLRQELLMLMK